jgi:hypothetical protein
MQITFAVAAALIVVAIAIAAGGGALARRLAQRRTDARQPGPATDSPK